MMERKLRAEARIMPQTDECDVCGESAAISALDRNAARGDGWVCGECADASPNNAS